MKHNRIVILCTLIMMVVGASPAFGESRCNIDSQALTTGEVQGEWEINPLYEDISSSSSAEEHGAEGTEETISSQNLCEESTSTDEDAYEQDLQVIVSSVREQMVARETTIDEKMYLQITDDDASESIKTTGKQIFDDAMVHTGEPEEGDSLLWAWSGYQVSYSWSTNGEEYWIDLSYSIQYYTTAAQETELNEAVESLKEELDIDREEDNQKIKAIYDYICENTAYDYDNLNDDSYTLKYSAYAALVNKAAVCQGYATLFYRLALEYDIDARVISGDANGRHGWNIVKIGEQYYYCDATWDTDRNPYEYFLMGSQDFLEDHTCDEEYSTADFLTEYPISQYNYTYEHSCTETVQIIPATPEADGSVSIICEECEQQKADSIQIIPQIASITLSTTSFSYDGNEKMPAITVKDIQDNVLTEGTDYEVSPQSSGAAVAPGAYVLTITFMGNYQGSVTRSYQIQACAHRWDDGSDINKAALKQAGTITYHCNVKGCEETKIIKIPRISLINLAYTKRIYNGNIRTPSVTIKNAAGTVLEKNKDYTVTYQSGRKTPGRYKVTIQFQGLYTGTKIKYFTIVPKATDSAGTKLNKALSIGGYDDVVFTWKKVTGASGYLVYYKTASASTWTKAVSTTMTTYTKKNLQDGKKYIFKIIPYYRSAAGKKYFDSSAYRTSCIYTLKKVSVPKISCKGTKVRVKWTNISGESGYQISRSTSKSGTNIVVKAYKTTSGTSKLLSAAKGTKYYYKVRAYKIVDGKSVFGPWSKAVSYKR